MRTSCQNEFIVWNLIFCKSRFQKACPFFSMLRPSFHHTVRDLLKIHIGYGFSQMLIELFKQFLIGRDTFLKAERTFNIIIIKRLVWIRWTSHNHANNSLGTPNHTRTTSDSEIHVSLVSYYIFQFCRITTARFLELQMSDICNSLLHFVILSHILSRIIIKRKERKILHVLSSRMSGPAVPSNKHR